MNDADFSKLLADVKRLAGLSSMTLSTARLRRNARAEEIEVPANADKFTISSRIEDSLNSRIATMIQNAAKQAGCTFEALQTRINENW